MRDRFKYLLLERRPVCGPALRFRPLRMNALLIQSTAELPHSAEALSAFYFSAIWLSARKGPGPSFRPTIYEVATKAGRKLGQTPTCSTGCYPFCCQVVSSCRCGSYDLALQYLDSPKSLCHAIGDGMAEQLLAMDPA